MIREEERREKGTQTTVEMELQVRRLVSRRKKLKNEE